MYLYLKKHEASIRTLLASGDDQDWRAIKAYHRTQIDFLQHERLIHLLVTLAFGFFMFGVLILAVLTDELLFILLFGIIAILEVFYVIHMYRLENGVQRWYVLYNELTDCEAKGGRNREL